MMEAKQLDLEMILRLVAIVAFSVTSYLSYRFSLRHAVIGLFLLVGAWLIVTMFLFFSMHAPGVSDWSVYLLVLTTVCLPSGLGIMVAGIIGWVRGHFILKAAKGSGE